jgi:hypothetical protein
VSGLLLGVDIGTSSTKGVLARPDGAVLATAERPHDLSLPRPGWAEHDAEEVWWADFVSVCEELLGKADDQLAAVCTSGIGASLLPADEAGPTFEAGDPLRHRHQGGEGDRGAQRALRGGDAPRALRLPADYPGSRAQAPLAAAQRARSLGEGAEVLHGELVHRVAAHRRVRPRPPLGKPVRPALRRALLPLDRGLGRGDSAGAAASASFVARRGGRGGDARGGAGYGHPRGDARGRGYHRRLE